MPCIMLSSINNQERPDGYMFRLFQPLDRLGILIILAATSDANKENLWIPTYEFHLFVSSIKSAVILFRAPEIEQTQEVGHLGYYTLPHMRGKSIIVRGIELIKPFMKSHDLTLASIICGKDNRASQRVAEKSGAFRDSEVKHEASSVLYGVGQRLSIRYLLPL